MMHRGKGNGEGMSRVSLPRKPRQERGKDTVRRLMEAGRRVFAERGYHGLHAGDIASAAGVSVGSFYAYFADKRELFLALLDEYTRAIRERQSAEFRTVSARTAADDVTGALEKIIGVSLEAHKGSPGLLREFIRMSLYDEAVRERLDRVGREARLALEKVLAAFIPGMGRRGVREVAYVLFHASEGVLHRLVLGGEGIGERRAVRALAQMLAAYVEQLSGKRAASIKR
jgi:AcrR family transcriptional regulator